jgi:hypothetical protein
LETAWLGAGLRQLAVKRAGPRRALDLAETHGRRGDVALASLRYLDAARHFATAAAHVPRDYDGVPLNWASTLGNQGVALVVLAQRRGDVVDAKIAVIELTLAFKMMRNGRNALRAAYYETRLQEAQRVVDRLSARPAEDKAQ